MNCDRFLIRVFDKQEEKMLYQDQKTEYGIFLGVNNDGVIFESDYQNYGDLRTLIIVEPFGDRYIPMQCMGRKDKNNKLFYQHDIIKTLDNCLCTVEIDENMSCFTFQLIGDERCQFCCTLLSTARAEIIGNKWENEKLLEVKE